MKFGDWVKKIRSEQNLDVREFAELVGIDSSTVSRAENSQTQPTLYTAFRICEAFHVSLPELLRILEEYGFSFEEKKAVEDSKILTLLDVQRLVNMFEGGRESEKPVLDFLTAGLNDILDREYSEKSVFRFRVDRKISAYTSNIVELLIYWSPISHRLELKYPPYLEPELFEFIYEQNGAFMLHDIERYQTVARLRGRGRMSTFPLSRIGTGSAIERVKLYDVLQLDKEAEQNGKIINMYWEAARFYAAFTLPNNRADWGPNDENWEIRLAVAYVTIYRWYQVLNGKDFIWKPDPPKNVVYI